MFFLPLQCSGVALAARLASRSGCHGRTGYQSLSDQARQNGRKRAKEECEYGSCALRWANRAWRHSAMVSANARPACSPARTSRSTPLPSADLRPFRPGTRSCRPASGPVAPDQTRRSTPPAAAGVPASASFSCWSVCANRYDIRGGMVKIRRKSEFLPSSSNRAYPSPT